MITAPPGIDVDAVTAWLAANVDGAEPPFTFDVIAGGHSNLTFRVTGRRRLRLRAPPPAARPRARQRPRHGSRAPDHRRAAGQRGAGTAVARLLRRPAVNGVPFYVMGFVEGHVVRDRALAEAALDASGSGQREPLDRRHDGRDPRRGPRRRRAVRPRPSRGLHRPPAQAVVRPVGPAEDTRPPAGRGGPRRPRRPDPRAGTGDDRPRRLPPRQLDRVRRRRRRRRARLGDLHARRPARRHRPAPRLLDRPGRRAERVGRGASGATTADGFWNRSQLAPRYAEVSGRDLSELDFYVAFGFWKLACIVEGVYARYLGGALGDRDPAELAPFAAQVDGGDHQGRRAPGAARKRCPTTGSSPRSPTFDEPVLIVMLSGWIDASGAAAAAMGALETECGATAVGRVRRRRVHRLPGPPAAARAAQRRQHRARVADAAAAGRPGPARPRRAAAQRSGAGHGVAPLHRRRSASSPASSAWPGWSPSAPTRSPRPTPDRRGCRRRRRRADVLAELPFRLSSVDVPAGMSAALEQRAARAGHPDPGHLGPGAPLRRLDVVPGGVGGPAGGSGDGDRDHRSPPTSCAREADAAAAAHRPAGRGERRAPGDGRPSSSGCTTPPRRPPTHRTPPADGGLEMRSGDELAAEVERFLREQGKS